MTTPFFSGTWEKTGVTFFGGSATVSGSCSSFTIPTTAGLVAWIDACAASSFTLSGTAIQTVVDQSSNGYLFTAGPVSPGYLTAGFNNRPTITFDDATTFQSLNYPSAALGTSNTLTIFAAATLASDAVNGFHSGGRLASYTAGGAANDFDNDSSFALARHAATSRLDFYRSSVEAPDVDIGYNAKRRIIFTLRADGERTLYIDGVGTSSAGTVANFASPGYLSLGGSKFNSSFFGGHWSGLVSEWGVYSTFANATAVGLLDTYLKNKWGM